MSEQEFYEFLKLLENCPKESTNIGELILFILCFVPFGIVIAIICDIFLGDRDKYLKKENKKSIQKEELL